MLTISQLLIKCAAGIGIAAALFAALIVAVEISLRVRRAYWRHEKAKFASKARVNPCVEEDKAFIARLAHDYPEA